MTNPQLVSERIQVEDSIDAVNSLFYEHGWTDGLPIIPPTEERVRKMLAAVDRDPQDIVAVLPPKSAGATVEKIALNAVMAGCLPEYLPVIIAAVEAITEEKFNLIGVQATTHPCGVLIVVNGPIRKLLKLNSKGNAFG
ncbi:thioredoxin, partial [Thermodesulfobacteriota bacterium]